MAPVFLVSTAGFFLLFGYECVRSPSNTLFQQTYGTENLPWLMGFLPLVLVLMVGAYNVALHRLKPRKTLLLTTLLSGVLLFACQQAIASGWLWATAALYLLREAYVPLIIEQYWSYLDSIQNEETAKTRNSLLMGSVSLGAMCGGVMVSNIATHLGTLNLPLLTCIFLIPTALAANWAFKISGEPKPEESTHQKTDLDRVGLSAFFKIPSLRWLFWLVCSTQAISAVYYLIFQTELQKSLPSSDSQTAFSGMFYASLNFMSLVFQFVVSPVVMRFFSKRTVQLSLPVIHLTTASIFIVHPSLETAALAFLLFKSMDYSLFRSSKELLYVRLPFEARYQAKEWIDVVGYRVSKGGTSLFLAMIQKAGMIGAIALPLSAVIASVAWIAIASKLTKEKEQSEPKGMRAQPV